MACPDNTKPCGCAETECGCVTSASEIAYIGPTLPCTGIQNCEKLDVIITKFDTILCSDEFIQTLINNITNNVDLYNQFATIVNNSIDCNVIQDCGTTTTTTTCECSSYTFAVSEGILSDQQVAFFECGETTDLTVIVMTPGETYDACIQNANGFTISAKGDSKFHGCCDAPLTTTTTTTAGEPFYKLNLDDFTYTTLADACAGGFSVDMDLYSETFDVGVGDFVYTDEALTLPYDGSDKRFKLRKLDLSFIAIQISTSGEILALLVC